MPCQVTVFELTYTMRLKHATDTDISRELLTPILMGFAGTNGVMPPEAQAAAREILPKSHPQPASVFPRARTRG